MLLFRQHRCTCAVGEGLVHCHLQMRKQKEETHMAFFNSAVTTLQTLVVALGAGLAIWGVINLMEGYGNDNRATRS